MSARRRGLRRRFAELFSVLTLLGPGLAASDTPPVAVGDGVVLWHRLDSLDSIGAGSAAGFQAIGAQFVPGRVGSALSLSDKAGSRLQVQVDEAALDLDSFTIEGWIQRRRLGSTAVDGGSGVILCGSGLGALHLFIHFDGLLGLRPTGDSGVISQSGITDLEWHHFAVTRAAGTVRFYIDGKAAGVSAFSARLLSSTTYGIGGIDPAEFGVSGTFAGRLDEIAVHRGALPGSYFQAVFAAGPAGKRSAAALEPSWTVPSVARLNVPFAVEAEFRNPTGATLTGQVATFSRSAGIRFVSATSSTGTVSLGAETAMVSIPTLAAGETAQVRLRAVMEDQVGAREIRLSAGGWNSRREVSVIDGCLDVPGLVARWPMEGTGLDLVGGGVGSVRVTNQWVNGPAGRGQVLKLFGGASALVAANPEPVGLDVFSLEMWFQRGESAPGVTTSVPRVLAASTAGGFSVGFAEDGRLIFSRVGDVLGSIPYAVTDLDWHHLVVVREPGAVAFHVDGVRVGTADFSGTFGPSTGFAIGGLPVASAGAYYGFVGSIDDVRIYNRRLDAAEIGQLAQGGGIGACPPVARVEPLSVPTTTAAGTLTRAVVRVRNTGLVAMAAPMLGLSWNDVVQFAGASSGLRQAVPTEGGARLDLDALAPGESRDVTIDVSETRAGVAQISLQVRPDGPTGAPVGEGALRIEVGRECVGGSVGLAAWYRAEGSAADAVGGSRGVAEASVGYGPGRVGKGFLFDGSGGVAVSDPPAKGSAFTVEAWVRPSTTAGVMQPIVFQESAGTGPGGIRFGLAIQGQGASEGSIPVGNLIFALGGLTGLPDEGGGVVDGRSVIPLNQWSHVALSVGAGRARVYVNGLVTREIIGLTGALAKPDAPLSIGARTRSLVPFVIERFVGGIDEVALHARELEPAQVLAIHAAGSIGRCDADLSVSFVDIRPRAAVGEAFPVRIQVENRGDRAVPNATLTQAVPAGWNVRSLATSVGSVAQVGGQIRAELGNLAPAVKATVDVVFEPVAPGEIVLEPVVAGDVVDGIGSNNTARATVLAGPPALRVLGGTFAEGALGESRVVQAQVALSAPVSHVVTVDFATGAAPGGSGLPAAEAGADYVAISGSLTFQPGETVKQVGVTVNGDELHELDEVFGVVLSNPAGAGLEAADGFLVIRDDEPVPVVGVDPVRVAEGEDAVFAVRLSRRSSVAVSVDWQTAAGSALAPSDFTSGTGTVVIPAGQLGGEVRIPVVADAEVESNEFFTLRIAVAASSAGRAAPGGRMWAPATVLNDDGLPGVVRGFAWNVPASGAPGVPVPVELRAVDGLGQVVESFNGPVTLAAVSASGRSTSPGLLLSELFFEPSSGVKLQNVSGEAIDASGWRLSFYDHTVWPVPVASHVLPAGTTVAAGGVFRITEGGSGPGAFPEFQLQSPVAWEASDLPAGMVPDPRRIAVLLQRPDGTVADFVSALGALPGEVDVPLTLSAGAWPGLPLAGKPRAGLSLQRVGGRIQGAADWQWMPGSAELRPNLWSRTPFDEAIRRPVSPSEVTLAAGRWSGALLVNEGSGQTQFLAADGSGRDGLSGAVTFAGLASPLRVVMDPELSPFVLRGSPRPFRWFVTNTGTTAVRDVSLLVAFDPALGMTPGTIGLFRPSQGTVDHIGASGDGTYRFRAKFGILEPGKRVMFEVFANVAGDLSHLLGGEEVAFRVMTELTHTGSPAALLTQRELWRLPYSTGLAAHEGGLVAWWKAEGDATESVGGHDGIATDVGYLAREDTRAFAFDGTGRVVIPDHPDLRSQPRRYWTVSVWLKVGHAAPERMIILEKGAATSGRSIGLTLLDGRPSVDWGGESLPASSAWPDLRDDQWHLLRWSLVPARDRVRVSLDHTGLFEEIVLPSGLAAAEVGDGPLRIGGGASGAGFEGAIDEVSLYRWIGPPVPFWTEASPSEFGAGAFGRIQGDLHVEAVRSGLSMPAAVVGRPYTLTTRVTNRGYLAASDIILEIDHGGGPVVQSIRRDGVVVPGTGPSVTLPLGRLEPGASTEVEWTFVTPTSAAVGTSPWFTPRVRSYAGRRDRSRELAFGSIPLHADNDGDGISDSWESLNGLSSANPADARLDLDGDGFSNRAEYEAGTSPRNPSVWPSVVWRVAEDGALVLAVPTNIASDYVLETRDSLTDGEVWSPVERRAGTGAVLEFRVVPPTGTGLGFYKVRPAPRW